MRKVTLSIAVAAVAIASFLAVAPTPSRADNAGIVPSGIMRNVAGIVTHSGGRVLQVGTAFFVAVPSRAFPGRSLFTWSPRITFCSTSTANRARAFR